MTSTTIRVTTQKVGVFHVDDVHDEAITAANTFLQFNHDEWHILWNMIRGVALHNHQVHYILTDVALGASAQEIKAAFDNNKDYQQPIDSGDESRSLMIDENDFASALGKAAYYRAWLTFFEDKISKHGWQAVLKKYLFSRTAEADDLLGRMCEGESIQGKWLTSAGNEGLIFPFYRSYSSYYSSGLRHRV